jgi:hypothetical protein
VIYLPHKRRFAYPLDPNDQDVPSLSKKETEIVYQLLPAEECEALVHWRCGRRSGFPGLKTGW